MSLVKRQNQKYTPLPLDDDEVKSITENGDNGAEMTDSNTVGNRTALAEKYRSVPDICSK